MSSINKALKKAQRERDVQRPEYVQALSGQRKDPLFMKKPVRIGGALVIACLVAFVLYAWLDPFGKKASDEKPMKHSEALQVPVGEKDTPTTGRRESAASPIPDKNTISTVENAEETYDRARAFHKIGRYGDAKRLYQQVLNTDPTAVDALNNLGVIYMHEKNYSAAQSTFERAIHLKPENVDPHYNLACVYSLKGELESSLSSLKRACSMDKAAEKWALTDNDLQNVRRTPEFNKIVKDLP